MSLSCFITVPPIEREKWNGGGEEGLGEEKYGNKTKGGMEFD